MVFFYLPTLGGLGFFDVGVNTTPLSVQEIEGGSAAQMMLSQHLGHYSGLIREISKPGKFVG